MQKVSIQQFRAMLDGRFGKGPVVRAYRELARRPEVAAETLFGDWVTWPPAGALASTDQGAAVRAYRGLARRPEVAAGARFREWVTWPPASA